MSYTLLPELKDLTALNPQMHTCPVLAGKPVAVENIPVFALDDPDPAPGPGNACHAEEPRGQFPGVVKSAIIPLIVVLKSQ